MKARFGKGFLWGAATASYQIEGAARDEGRGLSVWDMFCEKDGATWNRHTGAVACDHYHRWREDVALMKAIGLTAYRFSVAWPRVIPGGTGKVNAKGLAFYDRLTDALLAAGVVPFVTLFHWDYPYALYTRGGWLNADSPDWFAEYTDVVVRKLSDRVTHWMTLNEPQCFIGLGHRDGIHAPGDKLGLREVLQAAHHALLAHGKGVSVIRGASKRRCKIGYAPVGVVKFPASERPEDIRAARRAMFTITSPTLWNNTWWMDPIFRGQYPKDGLKVFEPWLPKIGPNDMKTIGQRVDFFGTNIYNGERIRAGRNGEPEVVPQGVGAPITHFIWTVTPESLRWGPRFFHERYKLPVYITENGLSTTDWVARDGGVHDTQRIDFTARYLEELGKAVADGVDVRGYFHWSLMDNFEWGEGYKQRFGMVHVDYGTLKRTPKDSAWWYRDVIRSNGERL